MAAQIFKQKSETMPHERVFIQTSAFFRKNLYGKMKHVTPFLAMREENFSEDGKHCFYMQQNAFTENDRTPRICNASVSEPA